MDIVEPRIITYHLNPDFSVDLSRYKKAAAKAQNAVLYVAKRSLQIVAYFFISVTLSTYRTLRYSIVSFKQTVLRDQGLRMLGIAENPRQLGRIAKVYLMVFKIPIWLVSIGFCFLGTTGRLFQERLNGNQVSTLLQTGASEGIDISHIQTKETSIDVSEVPAAVTVSSLLEILRTVNFVRPNEPGYLALLSRTEGPIVYTPEDLRTHLTKFVHNVNQRVPFLGTPPAYDTPRLEQFYQQIENAVRFSIHKVNKEIAKFQQDNGADVAAYEGDTLRTYKNLLEEQSRVAVDLAIAGAHCGARYMGDATTLYYNHKGEGNLGTLQEDLIELLAYKRKEVALHQVQRYLGADTHALSKYMSRMGELLAIPGTKNITEHLDNQFDLVQYVNRFFEEYTEDAIIDAVQTKIKNSQVFREKVIAWFADQKENWARDRFSVDEAQVASVVNILQEQPGAEELPLMRDFNLAQELLAHFRSEGVSLPAREQMNWDAFVTEIFALPEARDWSTRRFENRNERRARLDAMKESCSEAILGPGLVASLERSWTGADAVALNTQPFAQKFFEADKVSRIRDATQLEERTIRTLLAGRKDAAAVRAVLTDLREHDRGVDFGTRILQDPDEQPLDLRTNGLPPEHLEWFLVANNVFLPQVDEDL